MIPVVAGVSGSTGASGATGRISATAGRILVRHGPSGRDKNVAHSADSDSGRRGLFHSHESFLKRAARLLDQSIDLDSLAQRLSRLRTARKARLFEPPVLRDVEKLRQPGILIAA